MIPKTVVVTTEVLNMEKSEIQGFSLSDKICAVIGLGGLGTNVAVHLAGAGVGKLYLCDFDTVSESNLNRQFMYTACDVGELKCEALKERLSAYADDASYEAIKEKITDYSQIEKLRNCDIIFSCVDNNEARLILEDYCKENNIPLVHGGIDGFYGVAYLYVPSQSLSPSQAGLCEGGKAKYNISAVAGEIGSLQSSLGIKYLLTADNSLSGRILIFDENKTDTLNLNF